jgi:hypothetical protein
MTSWFGVGRPLMTIRRGATTARISLLFDISRRCDTLIAFTLFISDHFGDRDAGR